MKEKQKDVDLECIDRVLSGERGAYGILVTKYYQKMYRVAYRITGSSADAEDALQQAFLKSFTNLHTFKKKSTFSTWLYRITSNISINIYHQKKKETVGVEEDSISTVDDGLRAIESKEEIDTVRKAIRKLPKKQRLTLIFRVYEKLAYKEIAAILKCSEGAVKANYFHAVTKLKNELTSYMK
ncbi:RNA polymerase sigma factor [candidate division CSSED10-310 bacterium]|uniref:RNA polymerase sigma factor n=1 Tax=candidate division CSSED10-310 bacterium TaxID=2855610 RepID=A0ABV6Z006_UNCC1